MLRCALLLLSLMSFSAFADVSYTQLSGITHSPDRLSGSFTQEKYLKALDVSLTSTGVFTHTRSELIDWQTLTPIQNKLLLTPDSIIDGSGDNTLTAAPMFSGILFSVLTTDWEKLSQNFDLSGDLQGQNWQITLLPRDPVIAAIISRLELNGNRLLQSITLYEKGGDSTSIKFENYRQQQASE